jgi:formylglycine-generating enzyme required for sulfatase activity
MTNVFCIKCGTENPEDADFCYKCGKKLFRPDTNFPAVPTTASSETVEPQSASLPSSEPAVATPAIGAQDWAQSRIAGLKGAGPVLTPDNVPPNLAQSRTESEAERIRREHPNLVGIGGWLLWFCIVITIISPAVVVIGAIAKPSLSSLLDLGLAVYGIFAGVKLWKIDPKALTYTKVFLWIQFGLGVLFSLTQIMVAVTEPAHPGSPDTAGGRMFVGSIIWLLYFAKSKRVKATFGHSISGVSEASSSPSPIIIAAEAESTPALAGTEPTAASAQVAAAAAAPARAQEQPAATQTDSTERKKWFAMVSLVMLALLLGIYFLMSHLAETAPNITPQPAPHPAQDITPVKVQTKVNPKDGLTYVWIAPGQFMMGCSPGDGECLDSEKPSHLVKISKGFWIGQTLVTQAAYQRVTVDSRNPIDFPGERLPVKQVSWDEARSYCKAVGMRLPTEAEWEYAARAGSTTARYGDLGAIARYHDNSGESTKPVAQKQPNAWELYEMEGNVWEWVQDWYDRNYYGQSPATDPQGPSSGLSRVLRGGSWVSNGRVSFRYALEPGSHYNDSAFRCVGK